VLFANFTQKFAKNDKKFIKNQGKHKKFNIAGCEFRETA
jgi:hypothetical protein